MTHRYATIIKGANQMIDYSILNLSMIVSYIIQDTTHTLWINNRNYILIALICNLFWLLGSNITGLYRNVLNRDSIKTYRVIINNYLLFVGFIYVTMILLLDTSTYHVTHKFFYYSLGLFGLLLVLWKLIFLSIRRMNRKFLIDSRRAIVIGGGRLANELHTYFKSDRSNGYELIGFFDDQPRSVIDQNLYLGNIEGCIDYVIENNIDEIFCTLPSSESSTIKQLMMDADKNLIRFKYIPNYYDFGVKQILFQSFGHIPVLSVRPEPLENMLNRLIKRLFDIVFSLLIICFVFIWLFPILAIIIKLQSRGPVFFVQLRSGRDNEEFFCYKFRSMRLNNDSDHKQATRNDDRITPIGKFMRKTSIDELPQFFNVLMGNMSVVGPRPHMLNHTKQYSALIDQYLVRHFLKPGITGWAQIQGFRGETKTTKEMLSRVEADVWYLENWSFLFDMKIIFLTLWNAVRGEKNAY
ncbi:undecaprenyl-phosphate glucose phosphotransferase [Inquilinus sp. KBS0705]|nr:undecaprenyl-phosphate glucose phosphotransferase [Inquilinus sp. KBS0705]